MTASDAVSTAPGTGRRFALSARTLDSPVTPNSLFETWFAQQRCANRYMVRPIPFRELVGWRFEDGTGNLVHDSGRFFSIEGLHVRTSWNGHEASWSQPIINQPEIGILGILVKEFHGVLHCLMQAKMEPGNLDTVQLSPTVQATRSNFTRVHRGTPVTVHRVLRTTAHQRPRPLRFTPVGAGVVVSAQAQPEHDCGSDRRRPSA